MAAAIEAAVIEAGQLVFVGAMLAATTRHPSALRVARSRGRAGSVLPSSVSAAVSFGNNDSDENPFDLFLSGTVNDARLRFWFKPYAQAGTVYHIDKVVLRPLP